MRRAALCETYLRNFSNFNVKPQINEHLYNIPKRTYKLCLNSYYAATIFLKFLKYNLYIECTAK